MIKNNIEKLNEIKQIAENKGGVCLSDDYINHDSKLNFICGKGHKWSTTPRHINQGCWCPYCRKSTRNVVSTDPFEEIQIIAISKGGKCISDIYNGNENKLWFECKGKHTWEATPKSIKQGKWCPYCRIFVIEEICRSIFELGFGKPFPRTRMIPNPNSEFKLELDGYNDELKIAFEYNGEQHYRNGVFGRVNLENIKERDQVKKKYCKTNKITLIIIPFVDRGSVDRIYQQIKRVYLESTGNLFPVININEINTNLSYSKQLEKIKKIAENNGGRCISNTYINSKSKILFECSQGHQWEARPNDIQQGFWCPICVGTSSRKYTDKVIELQKIQKIAENRGGKCISEAYISNLTKLEFECMQKHRWWTTPKHIKQGTWCPFCKKSKEVQRIFPLSPSVSTPK